MSEIVPTPTPPIAPEITGAPAVKSNKGLYVIGAIAVIAVIGFLSWAKKNGGANAKSET